MPFACDFCNNTFSAKSSLILHQKRAKYCLEKRGIDPVISHVCEICQKKFHEKRYLVKHQEKCNLDKQFLFLKTKETIAQKRIEKQHNIIVRLLQQNKDNKLIISKLENQIFDLQNKLENVAIQGVKKPTTTTNNTVNLQPLTKEWLATQALLLTEEHILQGAAGLAQFAVDNSFRNRVVCTDINRKSLKYKENDGKFSKDPRGKKLSKMFFESIETKAENIIPTMIERIKNEMDGASEETGNVFESVCDKMDEIIKVKKGIKTITKGQEHELKEEFTRQLCELLPNP